MSPEDTAERQWQGLCALAIELEYDTQRPALQALYFEGIELWLKRFTFEGGEKWDTRKRSGSSSEPSTSS